MPRITPLAAPAPFDVWLVDLGLDPDDSELATLSAAEHERAERFVFARDRRRFLAAHVALRRLLAQRTGTPARAIRFVEGPFGKPSLVERSDCSFNLSHSGEVALVAIAPEAEIGVDVEMLHEVDDGAALAERNFTPTECRQLADLPTDARDRAFLRCWTRKEACLKAIGSGLSIAPETFEAGVGTDARVVRIATPQGMASIEVHSLPDQTGLIAAVARTRPA